MLRDAALQTLVLTTSIERAKAFYRDVLDLPLVTTSDGALVFRVGDGDLRVSPVPDFAPSDHTVFGFAVDDLDAALAKLAESGVALERIPGIPHGSDGSFKTPDGSRVAWFRDPDANLVSVVQYASGEPVE